MKKMKNYIVFYEDNWADEMDISGVFTCDENYKKEIEEKLSNYEQCFNYYIGTNEEIEYENGQSLLDCLTFKEITLEQLTVLSDVFEIDEEDDDYYVQESVYNEDKNGDFDNTLKNLSKEEYSKHLIKGKKLEDDLTVFYQLEKENSDIWDKYEDSNSPEQFQKFHIDSLSKEKYDELLEKSKKGGSIDFGFTDAIGDILELIEDEEGKCNI